MWLLYTFSLPISVPLLISVKFSFPSLSESRLSNKTFWAGAAWSYFLVGRQYFYFKIIWETFQKTCCRPRWNSSSKKMSPYIVQNLRKSYFVQNLRKSYIGRNIGKEWFNDRHLLVGLWGNTLLHSPPGHQLLIWVLIYQSSLQNWKWQFPVHHIVPLWSGESSCTATIWYRFYALSDRMFN